jgi:hypothetical protein
MFESNSIESNYCEPIKKRFGHVNRVAFELFIEVIFIPRYSRQHCSELWWNSDELHLITISARKEYNTLVKKFPLITLDQAKQLLYCY